MRRKGEVRVGTILISFVLFVAMLTAGIGVVDDFFNTDGTDPYNSGLNRSYYGGIDNAITDGAEINDIAFTIDDDLKNSSNVISDTDDLEGKATFSGFRSLLNIRQTYTLTRNLLTDINDKLNVPPFFAEAVVVILVIIVTIALISSLRGSGKL